MKCLNVYRVSHLVIDLGLVDFDLGVPPFCPAAKPLLPNSHYPRQSWAVEQSKSKSTKLSLGPDGTPCTVPAQKIALKWMQKWPKIQNVY